jgi:hypothetical protein
MNSIPWRSPANVGEWRRAKTLVNALFAALRSEGIVARQNLACCAECAREAIGARPRFVFYSVPDGDEFRASGRLVLRTSDPATAATAFRLATGAGLVAAPSLDDPVRFVVWRAPDDLIRTPLLLRSPGV